MKIVILAGGFGTRLAEYTDNFLTLVCQATAIIFQESEDRKLTSEHVTLAVLEVEKDVSN